MVLAPCNTLFLHGVCRSRAPYAMANAWPVEAADTACAARCTEARLLRGRGTCTAGGRRQAIVLKAINLNPVRMDQHPRGAPACFEQVLEESLETAPARVHRTNGLARHAALCAILAVGLPIFCSLMTTTCFAHPKTTQRRLAPEL